jgi:hypothetical protein
MMHILKNEKMKKIIYVIGFNLFICCKDNNISKNKIKYSPEMEHYKNIALKTGDDFAYGTYIEYADNNNLYMEKLSLSLIMNKRYNNLRSYYFIFRNYIELYNNNKYEISYLEKLNDKERLFIIDYLIKGAKLNSITCQSTLEKIFRNGYGYKKDSLKSDSLYTILENNLAIGNFYKNNKNNKSVVDSVD